MTETDAAQVVVVLTFELRHAGWSSPEAREAGLCDLEIAQAGSYEVVDDSKFTKRLREKTIQVLVPKFFREVLNKDEHAPCLTLADECEKNGTATSSQYAAYIARSKGAAEAAYVAQYAAERSGYFGIKGIVDSAQYASASQMYKKRDEYLALIANLAVEVLREMESPGCKFLNNGKGNYD